MSYYNNNFSSPVRPGTAYSELVNRKLKLNSGPTLLKGFNKKYGDPGAQKELLNRLTYNTTLSLAKGNPYDEASTAADLNLAGANRNAQKAKADEYNRAAQNNTGLQGTGASLANDAANNYDFSANAATEDTNTVSGNRVKSFETANALNQENREQLNTTNAFNFAVDQYKFNRSMAQKNFKLQDKASKFSQLGGLFSGGLSALTNIFGGGKKA